MLGLSTKKSVELTSRRLLLSASMLLVVVCCAERYAPAQDRNTLVLNDRSRVLNDGFWLYNSVEQGMEVARESGKPLLVIFRCIPCEACAQLDQQVVEDNPAVRKWLSRFVCVRVVRTNGMDLSLFQFDFDQSWAAFFLNADGTIYGRYGTRSHQTESDDDVTLDGFLASMARVLELHQQYPEVKAALQAKTGGKALVSSPEKFPTYAGKYQATLNYGPNVARSCIHCHQVGEAYRDWYWSKGEPIPDKLLYPYPHPKILGLTIDPTTATTVERVADDSWAAEAGFKAGDEIIRMQGQPIISMADMQWVLHHAPETAKIGIDIRRAGEVEQLELALPEGWREVGDISWRVSSWSLARMVTGGLRLESLSQSGPGIADEQSMGIGLRVRHVGQFNEHAAAKRAGVKQGDILVSVDGVEKPMTESQLLVHLVRNHRPGQSMTFELLRDGKRKTVTIPVQE